MKKIGSHIAMLLAVVSMLAMVSCVSRKKPLVPPQKRQFEWLTAHIDMEAAMNGNSFSSLTGQLRMRRDSVLWASVSTLGMEVIRLKMTNDSVWIINRMEKSYVAEPMDLLANVIGMPVSLRLMQNTLLGNPNAWAPEEHQVVVMNREELNDVSAKIKYSDIKIDEPTAFPCKITSKMERQYLGDRREAQP